MTGRLTRERDEINGIEIEKGDLEKVRTKISLKFKKNNDGKMSIMELVKHHKSSLVAAVREASDRKTSMKIRLRLNITYVKPDEHFDGEVDQKEMQAAMLSDTDSINKSDTHQKTNQMLEQINSKAERLEQTDVNGKPIGSGWSIKTIDELTIDFFETKSKGASSYIPTPARYTNAMCGLINIHNEDEECFCWCLKYHQSKKGKNDLRISALRKVEDKYNYQDIQFPVSYDDIAVFEEQNQVSIYVYEINESNNKIDESNRGNYNYITNDIIYLLRIDQGDKSHYVYIKNLDHFIHAHKHVEDASKRTCPCCQCKVHVHEFKVHISKCYNYAKENTITNASTRYHVAVHQLQEQD